ncbi:hypothetical protein EG329_000194 [Mollisiaceae sp. DMI_Dod_QoI]|nr:hypothetical protein EG329_000194 [Helotiales sp. DMI_Dod_QoI]
MEVQDFPLTAFQRSKSENCISLFDVHHPTADQQDPSWIRGGFFMKWNKNGGNITLICFGSFPKLEERLKRFIENTDNVQSSLYDPYTLYAIILDELHLKMDSIVWELISIYNRTETQIFEFANAQQKRSSRGYDVDFVRLHHLMKLVIHLKEACEAIIETAKSIQTAHNDLFNASHFRDCPPHPAIPATGKDLEYLLSSFHGLGLRIRSVETRASNVINLAFNLVIQRDSTLLQEDSQSMKTVAIMTLVFLPGTAVASIFGSQFFNADFSDSGMGHLKVSSDFWLFWVLFGGVTGITLLAWWIWLSTSTKRRFAAHLEHRGRGAASMA